MGKAPTLLIVAAALGLAIGVYVYFGALRVEAEAFDAHEWLSRRGQAQQNDPGCVRGGMALTLIQEGSLKNRKMTEVLEQLGQADATRANQLRYRLGQCHWDWRHSVLVVGFNAVQSADRIKIETE